MTTSELYRVYCRAYAEYDRGLDAALGDLVTSGSPVERAVAGLAVEDAVNGTSRRSREQFDQAVQDGLAALGPLGLRAA
jgi:hypothetical protein